MSIASESFEVRVGAEVSQRVVDARAADDRQAVDVLEIRTDGFGDAGPNPVVGRLARDVRERHHRDRVLDGAGGGRQWSSGSMRPSGAPSRSCRRPGAGRAAISRADW